MPPFFLLLHASVYTLGQNGQIHGIKCKSQTCCFRCTDAALSKTHFSTEQANIRIFAGSRQGQAPLVEAKKRLAGINTGYLCEGVPLRHNICFDMSQFSGRSTDLSIAADTLLVIEASANTTWQICSSETPQHHITQTRCIAVSSFQLHGFIAEEPQIQLMLHQTKGDGVKSTVLRQCKQHLNSFS